MITTSDKKLVPLILALVSSGGLALCAKALDTVHRLNNIPTTAPRVQAIDATPMLVQAINPGDVALENLGKFGADFKGMIEEMAKAAEDLLPKMPGKGIMSMALKVMALVSLTAAYYLSKFILSNALYATKFLAGKTLGLFWSIFKYAFHTLTLGVFKQKEEAKQQQKQQSEQKPTQQNIVVHNVSVSKNLPELPNNPNTRVFLWGWYDVNSKGDRTLGQLNTQETPAGTKQSSFLAQLGFN